MPEGVEENAGDKNLGIRVISGWPGSTRERKGSWVKALFWLRVLYQPPSLFPPFSSLGSTQQNVYADIILSRMYMASQEGS